MTKRHLTGGALEKRVAEILSDLGWSVEIARPATRWIGRRCRACGRGTVPRSSAHDFWGVADIVAFHWALGWGIVQCGPASQARKKRVAIDGKNWPAHTTLYVVTPDGRKGANAGILRWWRKEPRNFANGWREATGP